VVSRWVLWTIGSIPTAIDGDFTQSVARDYASAVRTLHVRHAAEIALRVALGAESAPGEPAMESRLNGSRAIADRTRHAVRRVREKLGMTQEQFAHAIAVTVSTVSRWETGHAVPSNLAWRAIRELAAAHGCMDYLLES